MAKTCIWCKFKQEYVCDGQHCGVCEQYRDDEEIKGFNGIKEDDYP